MIRQLFYKENRGKLVLWVLAIVALLGLLLPNKTKETNVQLDAIRADVALIKQELSDVEAGNASQLEVYSTNITQLADTLSGLSADINSVSTTVDDNKNDYNQRLSALQELWSNTVALQLTDYNPLIDDLEERVAILEANLPGESDYSDLRISYNEGDGFDEDSNWCSVTGDNVVGQQIKVGLRDIEVESVKLYMKRNAGSPSSVTFGIYKADSDGLPTGSALFKDTFSASSWDTDGEWHAISVENCRLVAKKYYCLILEDSNGTTSSSVSIGNEYGGEYSGGSWIWSHDEGDNWGQTIDADMGFEIWGVLK